MFFQNPAAICCARSAIDAVKHLSEEQKDEFLEKLREVEGRRGEIFARCACLVLGTLGVLRSIRARPFACLPMSIDLASINTSELRARVGELRRYL